MVQLSHLYMTTGKNIALIIHNFVCKLMSLLFNTLTKFISFSSKEQVAFNFLAAIRIHSDFGTQCGKVCHFFYFFPIYCLDVIGLDAMILVFWMLSLKAAFTLSSLTFIKSSSSLSEAGDISPRNLDSSLWFIQLGISHDVLCISSVQVSHSVVSDCLWLHGLQRAMPFCPSPTPKVYSNSCPLNRWCHPPISSSVVPFSHLQSFSASGFFQMSPSHQVAKLLEFQLQDQSFHWIFRTDFLSDGLVGSPCSPRDSQEPSPTAQFKSISSSLLSFLYSPTLTSILEKS